MPIVSNQLQTCFLFLCGEENTLVKSYFVLTECAEKKLPRSPLCPGQALVSHCGPGVSEVEVLRESRNSLLPQTVETSPFKCFKSCRELKIEAFWREETVLWGHSVCFGFYLPPWNAVKTQRNQHAKSGPCREMKPPHTKVRVRSSFWVLVL